MQITPIGAKTSIAISLFVFKSLFRKVQFIWFVIVENVIFYLTELFLCPDI